MLYNKWIIILWVLFCNGKIYSQINEINLYGGLNNAIADVGRGFSLVPSSYSFAFGYKKHLGTRYISRFDISYHKLMEKDIDSKNEIRRMRGKSFNSDVFEFSYGMDITFKEFDYIKPTNSTFYFIGELSAIVFSSKKINRETNNNGLITKKNITFGLPLGIGYKYKYNNWVLSVEYKSVMLFTNRLEGDVINGGESVKNIDNSIFNKVGDFYNSLVIGIGFSFGRTPCTFCIDQLNEDNKRRNRRK